MVPTWAACFVISQTGRRLATATTTPTVYSPELSGSPKTMTGSWREDAITGWLSRDFPALPRMQASWRDSWIAGSGSWTPERSPEQEVFTTLT
jgi:hypothetical protein